MHVTRNSDGQFVDCSIIPASGHILPSFTDGWRFNFRKHSQKPHYQTFILICEDTPDVIEGCLIFQVKGAGEPYMAYIEIAPHNKGDSKVFDRVAGCLIAYACRLSFIHGKDHFKGWLAFDVMEAHKEDEIKLMTIYCMKYGALRYGETTMVISPEKGEALIDKYLNQLL
ncbi:hypothetical protein [Dyadobacter sp. CY323]|uniref:hypothetical protein n=1 Tax=Dyadobacter sp. CY323 TaxID=2907302 RepID=UPI001F2A62E2|nr:hypothetical protein [Dyadobacter sp. CY323]MCE6991938.1 hypothetical protein [Dyadobacter sp. CY323]